MWLDSFIFLFKKSFLDGKAESKGEISDSLKLIAYQVLLKANHTYRNLCIISGLVGLHPRTKHKAFVGNFGHIFSGKWSLSCKFE